MHECGFPERCHRPSQCLVPLLCSFGVHQQCRRRRLGPSRPHRLAPVRQQPRVGRGLTAVCGISPTRQCCLASCSLRSDPSGRAHTDRGSKSASRAIGKRTLFNLLRSSAAMRNDEAAASCWLDSECCACPIGLLAGPRLLVRAITGRGAHCQTTASSRKQQTSWFTGTLPGHATLHRCGTQCTTFLMRKFIAFLVGGEGITHEAGQTTCEDEARGWVARKSARSIAA